MAGWLQKIVLATGGLALLPVPVSAAETCFHACLKAKMTSPSIEDTAIRAFMKGCRDTCEAEAKTKLEQLGLESKVASCVPARLAEAEVKKLRAASPSVIAYANAFTWDVNNVLPDKIIRRVEVTTQNMSLDDVTASGPVTVMPGETGTAVMTGVYDGYPSLRVTTRIAAVFACPK